MQCPYCNHIFPLTWQRYFTERTNKHTCPSCQKVSQLPKSPSYYLLLGLAQCIGGVPLAIYFFIKFGVYWPVAGWFLGGLLTGMPFDKMFLDEKFRRLEKLPEDQSMPDPASNSGPIG